VPRNWLPLALAVAVGLPVVSAQQEDSAIAPASPPVVQRPDAQRILGLIPNYQTVSDSTRPVAPLTVKEKFQLFVRSTVDPFVLGDVAMGAALSHATRGVPDYGSDRGALGARLGAAYADITSQGALTGAVFPALLHQDPRYFRLGPRAGVLKRIGYSLSRVAVIRTDSGKQAPNWSFLLGTAAAIGLSNVWYPPGDRSTDVMATRGFAITLGSATGNLLPEFWPDIHDRVLPHVLPYLMLGLRKGARRSAAPATLPAGY
jgi:hypothetical protein